MDPEANLREALELAESFVNAEDGEELDTDDAMRLAELVIALNEWIMGGGFLPPSWAKARA